MSCSPATIKVHFPSKNFLRTGAVAVALALLGILPSPRVFADEKKSVAERIAENFLEEFLAEGGIKKAGEGLGYAGSQRLGVENKLAAAYSQLVTIFERTPGIELVTADRIVSDPVYQSLLRKQGSDANMLLHALARDLLQYRKPESAPKAGINATHTSRISIVTFVGFNGMRGLAYGVGGLQLMDMNAQDAAALAQSLRSDYLIAVKLAPHIRKFAPMGAQAGSVSLFYRAKVFSKNGDIVFDEKIPGDDALVPPSLRFVGYQLGPWQLMKMNIANAFFLFPSEAQKDELAEIESRSLSDVMRELVDRLAKRMIKH